MSPSMLDLALSYAAAGCAVFPCRAAPEDTNRHDPVTGEVIQLKEKTPYPSNGFRAATRAERIIERWWRDHPSAIVGVATGEPMGAWVLDIDVKQMDDGTIIDGFEWLAGVEAEHGALPLTAAASTPRGGRHYYFRHVPGIRNRASFAVGADTRGDGGYTCAPGSVMADGRAYQWLEHEGPGLPDLPDAPTWLLDLVLHKAEPTTGAGGSYTGSTSASGDNPHYVEAAMRAELGKLSTTQKGQRGAQLNASAYSIGQLVASGAVSRSEAEAELYAAATVNGSVRTDGERTTRMTIKRGLDAGAQQPRVIPEAVDDSMAELGKRLASGLIRKALAGHNGRAEDAPATPPQEQPTGGGTGEPQPVEVDDTIRATPFEWKDPKGLPRREFVFGTHLARKYLSVTVAPGGVGKSSLAIVEALAMVTGKPLLGVKPAKPLRAWYWNGEDPRDELDRRIMAACLHYKIKPEDIADRLFLDSGRERGIVIARDDRRGIVIAKPVVEQVIETMLSNQIDVLTIDPFVSSHAVAENDNGAIDMVAKLWSQIADETNAAIEVIHHVRKTEGREITVEDGRGAGALLAAVRSARVLNRMTEDQATKASVSADDRMRIFSVQRGKANLAPMSAGSEWCELVSVPLGNGRGLQQPQDHAGVVTTWTWPSKEVVVSSIDEDKLRLMRIKVGNRDCRWSDQSGSWVGYAVAEALGVDLPVSRSKSSEKARIARMVDAWISSGVLVREDGLDDKGRTVQYVRVGRGDGEAE